MTSLSLGYIPNAWWGVRVVSIPNGKGKLHLTVEFSPDNLYSEYSERLVDRYIKETNHDQGNLLRSRFSREAIADWQRIL